jgi:hypothetical protein
MRVSFLKQAITCLAGGLALASAGQSLAAPLDPEVCGKLKEEQSQLVAAGAKANMERGPDWARANLARGQIKQIERLLSIEEQLAFRCPPPKPPLERAENQQPPVAAGAQPASDQPPGASPPKASGPQPKPKTPIAARDAGQSKPQPAKKTMRRPKVDDAYVAPPKASAVTPSQPPVQ